MEGVLIWSIFLAVIVEPSAVRMNEEYGEGAYVVKKVWEGVM